MKAHYFKALVAILSIIGGLSACSQTGVPSTKQSDLLNESLSKAKKLKTGMRREEIGSDFMRDGGWGSYGPGGGTLIVKGCTQTDYRTVKIDVIFDQTEHGVELRDTTPWVCQDGKCPVEASPYRPFDKIKSISEPYLDYQNSS